MRMSECSSVFYQNATSCDRINGMEMSVSEKHEVKSKLRNMFGFLFDRSSFFYYLLLLIAVGFAFFTYALFTEHFTTPFSGDYSQQAYPFYYNFYDDWWTFFKTGKFPFYDSNTFIGADNVYANTYYGLFSPFTFPILFFPRDFIPHAMALLSIAKLVTGGLLFRVYLKYMGCKETTARIFSIAYAFTGWMAYYLWFNTFYEVMSFLPLIIFGIEKVIRERKIWAVSLGFFLIGIGNYFFLLTLGIFGVIYAGFRFFQTLKDRTLKEHFIVIGLGFAGFLLGFMMCAVVVAPAIFSSFGINRSTSGKYWPTLKEAITEHNWYMVLKIMFTYWHPSIANWGYDPTRYYFSYAFPLASYFFPTVSGRYVNVIHYTEFENSGSSLFYFTPCIILFLCSFFRSIKNGKVSHLIAFAIVLVCLFCPFVYFLIGAFSNCYGRWEIVVPVIGLTYIALNFDHRDEMSRLSIIISGILTLLSMIGVFFLAKYIMSIYGKKNDTSTLPYIDEFGDVWGVIIYELVLVILETFLLGKFWKKTFLPMIVNCLIIIEAIVMGNMVANMHFLQSIETSINCGEVQFATETAIIQGINNQDKSFFRIQSPSVDEYHPNLPNAEGYNGISTFHTFYNNEVDDFVHMTQITNHDTSWSGLAYGKHANLDEFLGVKYYLTQDIDTTYYISYSDGHRDTYVFPANVPMNYEYQEELSGNGYKVWKNKYQIDFGTSYDVLYYKHTNENNPTYNDFYRSSYLYGDFVRNEEALFSGAILNDSDLEEVMAEHPDVFTAKTAPAREARDIGVRLDGIYGIYEDNCWFDPFNPMQYIDADHLIDPNESELPVRKYQLVYKPTALDYFEIGETGGYYMFDYPTRQTWGEDYSAVVFMIGMDDQVIKFDDLQNEANSNATGHIIRGLYSDVKIKRLIVVPLGNDYYKPLPALYYEDWGDVTDRYQNAINNGLTDVTYSVNDFTFKTNYEKERFVVTQVAYTKGWKVYAINSEGVKTELKTYNAQGGFVGFVAPSGDVRYEMSYMTPNIEKWFAVSVAGVTGVAVLTALPLVLRKIKKDSKKESN